MVTNTVDQFVGCNLWFKCFSEGTSEKGCVEIEDWVFSVHFVLGFEENSIYTLHLCFTKWCKVYAKGKAYSWFQKWHEELEQLQTSSGKSEKFLLLHSRLTLSGFSVTFHSTEFSSETFYSPWVDSPPLVKQRSAKGRLK